MCTVIVLRRPDHDWPLLLAANRDEMRGRAWLPPGRHWPDRPEVVAGLDQLAGGTWMGINDEGVLACVLNRVGTLGPADGKRSRGELVLEALDHGDAVDAAQALAHLDPAAYRPFNLLVADNRDAFLLSHRGKGKPKGIAIEPLADGLTMITARDANDRASPRVAHYLEAFREALPPDPDTEDWAEWTALLGSRAEGRAGDPMSAMTIDTDTGFATVCASLAALPAIGREDGARQWLFAAGPADSASFEPVELS